MLSPIDARRALRDVRDVTGRGVHLPMFDRVLAVTITDTVVAVQIDHYDVRERPLEYVIEGRVTRTYLFRRETTADDFGPAMCIDSRQDWTEVHIRRVGQSMTPERFAEQLEHEVSCHRPGTKSSPMDSAARALDMTATGGSPMADYYKSRLSAGANGVTFK